MSKKKEKNRKRERSTCEGCPYFYKADIRKFYDSVSLQELNERLGRTIKLLQEKMAKERDELRRRLLPNVYISGAIAHHDLKERMETFGKAEKELNARGYYAVNPFKNGVPQDADWRQHMRKDIELLVGCQYIYMLKGWELSKGAKLELDVASSCGIEVLFQ